MTTGDGFQELGGAINTAEHMGMQVKNDSNRKTPASLGQVSPTRNEEAVLMVTELGRSSPLPSVHCRQLHARFWKWRHFIGRRKNVPPLSAPTDTGTARRPEPFGAAGTGPDAGQRTAAAMPPDELPPNANYSAGTGGTSNIHV